VHPTLGSLARFQAVFYALAFFWLDGVPPPAHTPLTQTVSHLPCKIVSSLLRFKFCIFD
jgi:hypothetical protein